MRDKKLPTKIFGEVLQELRLQVGGQELIVFLLLVSLRRYVTRYNSLLADDFEFAKFPKFPVVTEQIGRV